MEVEAKFAVPNRRTYLRLVARRSLAGYRLAQSRTVGVSDWYFDTSGERFLSGGYSCRIRREPDRVIATLKGLQSSETGSPQGAVHRREEQEVELPEWTPDVAAWPAGPARELALRLSAGDQLLPLFELAQVRTRSEVMDGERHVAELSVDAAAVKIGARPQHYYEVEVELKDAGVEGDLDAFASELSGRWRLAPETRSKFQRAYALYQEYRRSVEDRLSAEERSTVETYMTDPRRPLARRAAAVLGWASGLSPADLAQRTGLSRGRVLYWLRAFRDRRLGIFDRHSFRRPTEGERVVGGEPAENGQAAPEASDETMRPQDGQMAAEETTEPQPGEPPAGPQPGEGGQPAPESAADEHTGEGAVEGAAQAEAEATPSKRPSPPQISPDEPMSEAGRKILYTHFMRMVENEDGTRSGEDPEALHDMRVATRRMRAAFQLFEPYYDSDAIQPYGKGLKRTGRALGAVRDLDVLIGKAKDYQGKHLTGAEASLDPLLAAWDERREAARRAMTDYLDGGKYDKFRHRFEEFLTTPGAGAPPANGNAAEQQGPGGRRGALRVRHVVAGLIFTRYEGVRAYETYLPDAPLTTYHALRIECKRLRYAMEFFRDVLGAQTGALIKQVTGMQDLLGDLHDSVVAEGMLAEFLNEQAARRAGDIHPPPLDGVTRYLSAQWVIQRELLGRFPDRWSALTGADFRRELSLAVAVL